MADLLHHAVQLAILTGPVGVDIGQGVAEKTRDGRGADRSALDGGPTCASVRSTEVSAARQIDIGRADSRADRLTRCIAASPS